VKLARHIILVCRISVSLYVDEVYFVCICVIKFEVLLAPGIAATALVFVLVDFNDATI